LAAEHTESAPEFGIVPGKGAFGKYAFYVLHLICVEANSDCFRSSATEPEVDGDSEEDDGEAEEGVSGLGDDGERQDDEGGEDEKGGEDGESPDAEGAGSSGDVIAAAEDEDGAGSERIEEPLGEDG